MESLWHSRLIQTTFALFWMFCALVVMIRATRQASVSSGLAVRRCWGGDAQTDAGGQRGRWRPARAVAFIGVAIPVLIVGYFSPLPPKAGEEK